CRKAGAECITNPSLPMGRPPLSSKITSGSGIQQRKASVARQRRNETRADPKEVPPSFTPPESEILGSQRSNGFPEPYPRTSTNIDSATYLGDPDFNTSTRTVHEDLLIDIIPSEPTLPAGDSVTEQSPPFVSNRQQGPSNVDLIDIYAGDPAAISPEPDPEETVMRQISVLSLDLYRQLKDIKSDHWWDVLDNSAFETRDFSALSFSTVESLFASSKAFSSAIDQMFPSVATVPVPTATRMTDKTTCSISTGNCSATGPDHSTAEQTDTLLGHPSFVIEQSDASLFPSPISTESIGSQGSMLPSLPTMPTILQGVDTAALLAILGCYVRLVHLYGILFSRFHEILSQGYELPTILPHLSMGGFQLQGNIQMLILVQVCVKLLDKVERALELDDALVGSASCWHNESDVKRKVSRTLLETVMGRDEIEGSTRDLREKMRTVQALLSANLAQDL
ncbi:MAG: hypothetical protein Q9214_006589, partial [Letrouitia sp. 1 TL-2023]